MTDYPTNYTNKETIFDVSDTIHGHHVKSLYDELGSSPSGSFDTVAERLADVDTRLDTGGTPPSSTNIPSVPTGYSLYAEHDFDDNTYLKVNGGWFAAYDMRQASPPPNTRSRNLPANVGQTGSVLRLRSSAESANGMQYTSGYVGTNQDVGGGTDAQSYFPLFGRYQFLVKYPITHGHWNCVWLNYRGSSAKFEIDLAEMFTAQQPGKVQMVTHRNPDYAGDYNYSMLNTAYGTTEWFIPDGPQSYGGAPAATHWGKAVDFEDPVNPTNPSTQQSDWHLVEVEIVKVLGANGGWTVDIEFYVDEVKCVTWRDTTFDYNAADAVPAWYESGHDNQAGDDAYSWDIRFDSWIGGNEIGQVETSTTTAGEGTRVLTYNGLNGLGNTQYMFTATGDTVPDLDLWIADLDADYYMEVDWFRVLTNDSTPTAPPTQTFTWEFDGTGVDEADLDTTEGGSYDFDGIYKAASTDIKWDTAQFLTGDRSIRFNGTGTACNARYHHGSELQAMWARAAVRFDSLPAADARLFLIKLTGQGATVGTIRLLTDGSLILTDEFDLEDTSASTLSADTWYQIEWGVNASADTQSVKIWDSAGTTLIDELFGAYSNASGPADVSFGFDGSPNFNLWMDAFAVDTDDWIGPYTG